MKKSKQRKKKRKKYFPHEVYTGKFSGKDSVRLLALGGSGTVTKNMFVYEYRIDDVIQDILIIDCGIGFPEPEMYGVDLLIPDVRYLDDKMSLVRGIVLTHGHEDHIGGLPYIYSKLGNIPTWGTRLAAAFSNAKLKEAKIKHRVTPVNFDKVLHLGAFTVSFIRITHSIPDTAHVVIDCPVGQFYHGSDFKFDFHPLDGKLSEIEKINTVAKKGVLCLVTDCLGSERTGFTPPEASIGESIERELSFCNGKCLFTTVSSNISRIQMAIDAAIKNGRQVAFIGRSIDRNVEEAIKLGLMKFSRSHIIRDRDLKKLPPNKQFLVVAGSQGQESSSLTRVANDEHRFVSIEERDTVIFSSDPIPGNEYNVNIVIDQLFKKGARVSYSSIMSDLHVSGHGSQGDLMLLLSSLGPKYVYPIGGTYRHVAQYKRLARELGFNKQQMLIPDEGKVLSFSRHSKPRIVDSINLEHVMVDGLGIGDVGKVVLRDRKTISSDGIVMVIIAIEKSSGKLLTTPDIVTRGFVYKRESTSLLKNAVRLVEKKLVFKKGKMFNWQHTKRRIEESLGSYFQSKIGRAPLVVPVILEV